MVLFLEPEVYDIVSTGDKKILAVNKLMHSSHLSYYQTFILCECEKNKLYEFFLENTKNSKKKIKRLKINDQQSADLLTDRLVTQFNKLFSLNEFAYRFNRMLPTMEIIRWQADCDFKMTFNSITKNMYLPKSNESVYGTFVIPLIKTTCNTLITELGEYGLSNVGCVCDKKCNHGNKCPCKGSCTCGDPFEATITENVNLFYLSDLEPVDIMGEERLNLYVHLEFVRKGN